MGCSDQHADTLATLRTRVPSRQPAQARLIAVTKPQRFGGLVGAVTVMLVKVSHRRLSGGLARAEPSSTEGNR